MEDFDYLLVISIHQLVNTLFLIQSHLIPTEPSIWYLPCQQ